MENLVDCMGDVDVGAEGVFDGEVIDKLFKDFRRWIWNCAFGNGIQNVGNGCQPFRKIILKQIHIFSTCNLGKLFKEFVYEIALARITEYIFVKISMCYLLLSLFEHFYEDNHFGFGSENHRALPEVFIFQAIILHVTQLLQFYKKLFRYCESIAKKTPLQLILKHCDKDIILKFKLLLHSLQ